MKKIIFTITIIFCLSGCSLFKNVNEDTDQQTLPKPTWIEEMKPHTVPDELIIFKDKADNQVPMGKFGEQPSDEKKNKRYINK